MLWLNRSFVRSKLNDINKKLYLKYELSKTLRQYLKVRHIIVLRIAVERRRIILFDRLTVPMGCV